MSILLYLIDRNGYEFVNKQTHHGVCFYTLKQTHVLPSYEEDADSSVPEKTTNQFNLVTTSDSHRIAIYQSLVIFIKSNGLHFYLRFKKIVCIVRSVKYRKYLVYVHMRAKKSSLSE